MLENAETTVFVRCVHNSVDEWESLIDEDVVTFTFIAVVRRCIPLTFGRFFSEKLDLIVHFLHGELPVLPLCFVWDFSTPR